MKPTEILSQEHRVIERVLDCLEALAEEARRSRRLDLDSAEQAIRFFETFADRCHHGKEEERLFPAMLRNGLPRDAGPLPVLLDEHERGRVSIRGMKAATRSEAVEAFVEHASTFVALLRDHIAKEDVVFFPLADRLLDEEAQAALLQEFVRFEHEEVGADTHADMVGLAKALTAHFGVRPHPPTTFACGQHAPGEEPSIGQP